MGGKARNGCQLTWEHGCRLICSIADHMLLNNVNTSTLPGNDLFTMVPAGSFRRGKRVLGDLDIIVLSNDVPRIKGILGKLLQKFSGGEKKFTGLLEGVQVDFVVSDKMGLGAALMHCTGPVELNVRQRAQAKRMGLLLNEKGLWRGDERLACSSSEREIYETLGLRWLEPEGRG